MKILFAYYADSGQSESAYHEIARCAPAEIEVSCFNLWLPLRKSKLDWERLDRLWKHRDPTLMALYRELEAAAQNCDALIVYNGRNVHPEFAASLDTFNVFSCFDDPESSSKLSYPAAPAFDAVFYGNIASGFQYESWGCEKRAFLPIFTAPSEIPKKEEEEQVLHSPRTDDIVLVCGRNDKRRRRMDMLVQAFPQAAVYGKNWNRGWIDDQALHELYLRSKVGWNIHNSTGPINKRLYALAAYGVLPICDNKVGLGEMFQLGVEAVGADTIPEMIDLTRYYLEHDEERAEIAAAAYRRYWADYHAEAIWNRIHDQLKVWGAQNKKKSATTTNIPSVRRMEMQAVAARVRGRIASMRNGLKNRLSRMRNRKFDDVSSWYDERRYLGESVSFDENAKIARYRRPLPLGDQAAIQSEAHAGARMWVLASLVCSAWRILCEGHNAGRFSELASVRAGRSVTVSPDKYEGMEIADDEDKYDAVVSTGIISNGEELLRAMSRWRNVASTAICCYKTSRDEGAHARGRELKSLCRLLRQSSKSICSYYMPDIYVPWIEPVTKNANGELIIFVIHW